MTFFLITTKSRKRESRWWHQGLTKKVLGRFAFLSGFRIKCGMTEFKVFNTAQGKHYTKLHSKADRGGDEESTQAYVLVRRGDNKDMQMKATWY